MTTLTYCKGLPTPTGELNELGFTTLEMFLSSFAPIFHKAACETVAALQSVAEFNFLKGSPTLGDLEEGATFRKSKWNTHLQTRYGISKRHANGVISFASGCVDSARECRVNHLKALTGQIKSISGWIDQAQKKLKNALKFYAKKKWRSSKSGCNFPLSSSLNDRRTNWQHLRWLLHQKRRRLHQLNLRLNHLKSAPIRVRVPPQQVFIVGSKDEKFGNQICQWDGGQLRFRVPTCLESRFGSHVKSEIGNFDRKINRLPGDGAKTWHFYYKDGRWGVAVHFTPKPVQMVSRHSAYGAIGIDLNPGSVGWAYVNGDGNLKAQGKIPLQMGLPQGQQQAQIVDACLQLATLATTYACPVVCEELDFGAKKRQLRERSRKYARMLSGWAYSNFFQLLTSILANRGIYLMTVNPAYTSLIGLVKYAHMYGLSSDVTASLVIARRGMRLSESLPNTITAYLDVKSGKHVWHWWSKLNKQLKESGIRRHDFYSISNWESLVKPPTDVTKVGGKRGVSVGEASPTEPPWKRT